MQEPVQPTKNPFLLFQQWFDEACKTEPCDPNAICLATVDADGRPSARMVLLKDYDAKGFVFYTNYESRKGQALQANPDRAAFCMHWKSLNRQVRVEGIVEPVTEEEANAYFQSRPRGSRIGAWASKQSRKLDDRQILIDRVAELEKQYEGLEEIPRPAHWSGFRLVPDRIEFWAEQPFRLHDRVLYQKTGDDPANDWSWHRLYP